MNKTTGISEIKGFKLKPNSYFILIIVSIVFLSLSFQNINSPFIHVSEDTNGQNGLAALNTLKYGIKTTKLGLYVSWLEGNKNFNDLAGNFYANHPAFFILPTIFLYKLFGVSEFTTRLGPLFLMFIAFVLFFFALKKIFSGNLFLIFTSLFIFVILPGTIYYGKHLDPSPPVLAASLISYSLFILYYFNHQKLYFYLFFVSMVFGLAMGWHYAAMPFSIWLFIIIFGKKIPNKKYFLVFIPIISFLAIVIQLFHIYLLNGIGNVYSILFESYSGRSGFYAKYLNWWKIIYERSTLNFTKIFLYIFIISFIWWLYDILKIKNQKILPKISHKISQEKSSNNYNFNELIMPIILMPVIITTFFQQWSTHPFGVIFYLPAVSILNAIFLYKIYQNNVGLGIFILIIVLIIGFLSSLSNLNFFYEKFLILEPNDINLLKELGNKINSNELCIGRNQNLYFGGIIGFYLKKEFLTSPFCLEKKYQNQIKYALVIHPTIDEFTKKELELFEQNNFKFLGCSGVFCLMQK